MIPQKKKIIRITTVPDSLKILLKGQLKYMSQYFEIIGVSGSGRSMDEVTLNEAIRTETIEMTRTISPLRDLVATFKLYRFLKKERPHIVHTHTPKAGIVGMLAAKLAGVKHRFHTVAGMPLLESKGPKRALLNLVEKRTYSYSTLVLPNSQGLYNIILDQKFSPESKLKMIGKGSSNGIDIEYFNPALISESEKEKLKLKLHLEKDDIIFTFIGRLVKDKGVNELIKAFTDFLKINEKSKLILVGQRENNLDPLKRSTEKLIMKHPEIIPVGWQSDVRPYLAIADVFVFPTYREGFPNVVLQAGAMGLPCIVTDINGCNEIISNKVNGLIIPTKHTNAIFDAMKYFQNHPDEQLRMASNSRENIAKNYQHLYIWEELLKIYQSAE